MREGHQRPSTSTLVWLAALTICVAAGIALAFPADLPPRFGVYLAVAAFGSGVVFGLRGALLPAVGIVACGLAAAVRLPFVPATSGDDGRAMLGLFFTILPIMFAVPALGSAAVRWIARSAVSAVRGRLLRSAGTGPISQPHSRAPRERQS